MDYLMLDLCSGLKGASQAMRQRGWKVISIDNNIKFKPDIVADIRDFSWRGDYPTLIWASPPCDEFSREFMPWCSTGKSPDMSIVLACKRIIDESAPNFWVIENVKGAVKYFESILGRPRTVYNPYYLWGNFPLLDRLKIKRKKKEAYSSTQKAERAKVPYSISLAMALGIEQFMEFEF